MVLAFSSTISSSHRYVQGAVTAKSISLVVLFQIRVLSRNRKGKAVIIRAAFSGFGRQQIPPRAVTQQPGIPMKHLPPTIKQLLKLRGPNPPPPVPIPKLNAILKSTLLDAKQKNAETAWLVLTVRHQRNPGFRVSDGLSTRV